MPDFFFCRTVRLYADKYSMNSVIFFMAFVLFASQTAQSCMVNYNTPPSPYVLHKINQKCSVIESAVQDAKSCRMACRRFNIFLDAPKCRDDLETVFLPCRSVCLEYKQSCKVNIDCSTYPNSNCNNDAVFGKTTSEVRPQLPLCSNFRYCAAPIVQPVLWKNAIWGKEKTVRLVGEVYNNTVVKTSGFYCINEFFRIGTNCSFFDPVEDECLIVDKFVPTCSNKTCCDNFREAMLFGNAFAVEVLPGVSIPPTVSIPHFIPHIMFGWQCLNKDGKQIPCSHFSSGNTECAGYGMVVDGSLYVHHPLGKVQKCEKKYQYWSKLNEISSTENANSMFFSLF